MPRHHRHRPNEGDGWRGRRPRSTPKTIFPNSRRNSEADATHRRFDVTLWMIDMGEGLTGKFRIKAQRRSAGSRRKRGGSAGKGNVLARGDGVSQDRNRVWVDEFAWAHVRIHIHALFATKWQLIQTRLAFKIFFSVVIYEDHLNLVYF